ncbi:MAG: DUF2510 domain-containing protein [Dermatophilaceae bacterium]
MSNSPPGWYPQEDGRERYWTGERWSEHFRESASMEVTAGRALARSSQAPAAPTPMPYGHVAVVAPKNAGLAVVASFFVPGLGQLVNGEAAKGVLIFIAYLTSFARMFVLIGFLTAPAVWIWGMVDAHSSARAWNLRHGILS